MAVANLLALLVAVALVRRVAAIACGSITVTEATIAAQSSCTSIDQLTLEGAFSNLDALDNVETIHHLSVQNNDEIVTLHGFPSLTTITGDFLVQNCANLKSISGFNAVTNLYVLRINNCTSLESVVGLHNVTQVVAFHIGDYGVATNLTTLDAFQALETVQSDISLVDCPSLRVMTGFKNLKSWGQISLRATGLESLVGIARTATHGGSVSLLDNAMRNLTDCFPLVEELTSLLIWDPKGMLSDLVNSFTYLRRTTFNFHLQTLWLPHVRYFDNLTYVGTEFKFQDWKIPVDFIDAFNNVTSIGTDLIIDGNNLLTQFSGFKSLTTIGGNVLFQANGRLQRIGGFDELTSVTEMQFKSLLTDGSVPAGAQLRVTAFPKVPHLARFLLQDCGHAFWAPLPSITDIQNVNIMNGNLRTLDVLHGVTNVTGTVSVSDLSQLESFRGLQSLVYWQDVLSFTNLPLLSHLVDVAPNAIDVGAIILQQTGIANLTNCFTNLQATNALTIATNPSMTTMVDSFMHLQTVRATFKVQSTRLPSVYWSSLANVGWDVVLSDAHIDTDISGFESLVSIGRDLVLDGNDWTQNVTGFNALLHIGGKLQIQNFLQGSGVPADARLRITGLMNLRTTGGVLIKDNERPLDTNFAKLHTVNGDFSFTGNAGTQFVGFESIRTIDGAFTLSGGDITDPGLYQLQTAAPRASVSVNINQVCCSVVEALFVRLNWAGSSVGTCRSAGNCDYCWPWSAPALLTPPENCVAIASTCGSNGVWSVPPLQCTCDGVNSAEPCEIVDPTSSSAEPAPSSSSSSAPAVSSSSSTGLAVLSSSSASSSTEADASTGIVASSSSTGTQVIVLPVEPPAALPNALRFSLDLRTGAGTPTITLAFLNELAAAMGVAPSKVQVVAITGGKLIIDILDLPATAAEATLSQLQSNLNEPAAYPVLAESLAPNARATIISVPSKPSDSLPQLSTTTIIAIAVGVGAVLIIATAIIYGICRKRSKKRRIGGTYTAGNTKKGEKNSDSRSKLIPAVEPEKAAPPQVVVNNFHFHLPSDATFTQPVDDTAGVDADAVDAECSVVHMENVETVTVVQHGHSTPTAH